MQNEHEAPQNGSFFTSSGKKKVMIHWETKIILNTFEGKAELLQCIFFHPQADDSY